MQNFDNNKDCKCAITIYGDTGKVHKGLAKKIIQRKYINLVRLKIVWGSFSREIWMIVIELYRFENNLVA